MTAHMDVCRQARRAGQAMAILLVALLAAGCGGYGDGSFDLTLVGQVGGIVEYLHVDGARAFVTLGPAVAVMDLADPAREGP